MHALKTYIKLELFFSEELLELGFLFELQSYWGIVFIIPLPFLQFTHKW